MQKTITKAHHMIFRAVAGAVINTAHGHPKWGLNVTMAESIAKRATGTLTASWPDVLAAHTPSKMESIAGQVGHWPPSYRSIDRSVAKRGASRRNTVPLSRRKLVKELSFKAGQARRSGDFGKMEAYIDVLRIISKL